MPNNENDAKGLIAESVRECIKKQGEDYIVFCDNGKEYTAREILDAIEHNTSPSDEFIKDIAMEYLKGKGLK